MSNVRMLSMERRPDIVKLPCDVSFVQNLRCEFLEYLKVGCKYDAEFKSTVKLMQRILTRRKNSFYRMVAFRRAIKLNSSVNRLFAINLEADLEWFYEQLPDIVPEEVDDESNELPSRTLIDYIMLQILHAHNNYQRVFYCAQEAANYFVQLVRSGYFIDTNTIFLAVFARLHRLSRLMGNKYAELYNMLQRYKHKFPQSQSSEEQSYEHYQSIPDTLPSFPLKEFDAPDPVELLHETSIEKVASKEISYTKPPRKHLKKKRDIGVVVDRESIANAPAAFSLESLVTAEDVKRFIDTESKARSQSLSRCVTKEVNQGEWNNILKLLRKRAHDAKSLSTFRKFLSAKIET